MGGGDGLAVPAVALASNRTKPATAEAAIHLIVFAFLFPEGDLRNGQENLVAGRVDVENSVSPRLKKHAREQEFRGRSPSQETYDRRARRGAQSSFVQIRFGWYDSI